MATATVDFTAADAGMQASDTGQPTDLGQSAADTSVQSAQDVQVDGRRGPTDIRTAAKSIADAIADPSSDFAAKFPGQEKAVKSLADSYFRADAYAKVFPRVEEAAAAKQLIDAVGGIEGVTQIQTRLQQQDVMDGQLKTGDPAALDSAFKNFPEGMATLAPHYLDRLQQTNPQAFENTIAPHAISLFDKAGVLGHVAAMAAETDPARKSAMANELASWMKQQGDNVKNLRNAAPKSPVDDQLKQRMTAQEQRENEFFSKQVDLSVNNASAPQLTKIADQYAKTYKLNDIQKTRFASSLAQRVVHEMLADKTFKDQDSIRRNSKDVEKVASFRAAEFTRRLEDAAFKEAQELYGATSRPTNGTGEVKPAGPKSAPDGGPLLVSRAMTPADLDMRRDPNGYLFIANKGYRKDGTFVTWKE